MCKRCTYIIVSVFAACLISRYVLKLALRLERATFWRHWASNECMSLNEWPRRYWRVKWWMNESQSKSYYTARWMNEGRYRHKQTLHNIVIHSTDRQTGRHKDERRRYSRECRIHNFIILELKLKNVTKKHRTHFWYVFDTSHILRHDGVRWVGTVESPLGR